LPSVWHLAEPCRLNLPLLLPLPLNALALALVPLAESQGAGEGATGAAGDAAASAFPATAEFAAAQQAGVARVRTSNDANIQL